MRHAFAGGPTVLLALILAGLAPGGGIRFHDVTSTTGVDVCHTDGGSGRRYIVETVSAGLALFDYDGDGDVDLYLLNGAPLQGTTVSGPPPRNRLYRNEGAWRFTDVTEAAGVGDRGYGLGVTVGDYDHDGDEDLYLNNYGPNVLYRNNGDGTFTDVTAAAGVGNGDRVGAGACFLDMDADGDLDLYVANYLVFDYAKHVTTAAQGVPVYANPRHYEPLPDTLYRNNGDGTFTDVSATAGIAAHRGWGMGIVAADYDNDGDTDVYVGNDVAENFLFQNDGHGHFEEMGLISGTAYDGNGDEQGSMGVACGDYDNDGWLDFFQTSYQGQLATLYHNLGDASFADVTLVSGAGRGTLADVTWGTAFADFDNDGQRDLFIACGHLQDTVEQYDDTTSYRQRNRLLRNQGDGTFLNVTGQAGDGLAVVQSSRGLGCDDLDNDGDVDVVVLNARARPTLLRNDTTPVGHWLQLDLRGRANRFGVGARVTVTAGALRLTDEVHSGRSYQSHFGTRLYFGLGSWARVDRVTVRWIGGGTDTFADLPGDTRLTLHQGGDWRRTVPGVHASSP